MFTFRWKNSTNGETHVIPASIANRRYPQIVIQFYEDQLFDTFPEYENKENYDTTNFFDQNS